MTTAVTPYMIKNFKRANSVAFEVITDKYSNESLKATGNGTVTIEFTTEVSTHTSVKTHGIEFIVDLQILIDNSPLQNIDQTLIRVDFSGLDLKFLGDLLKPNDCFDVYITVDNLLSVVTVNTKLAIYRKDEFLCDVSLPTKIAFNLTNVIGYTRKA